MELEMFVNQVKTEGTSIHVLSDSMGILVFEHEGCEKYLMDVARIYYSGQVLPDVSTLMSKAKPFIEYGVNYRRSICTSYRYLEKFLNDGDPKAIATQGKELFLRLEFELTAK